MDSDLPSDTSSDESFKPSDEKNIYICTYKGCTASFSKNSKLTYHIRRHTGERPFICDEPNCGKTYLYSFHLRRHRETHHNSNISIERVRCTHEGCYLELANKYSLKKHIKRKHYPGRQYPFSCDECQQGFHRKRQLLQHSYIHTGVFPYVCEICETRFPTTGARNRHKRTHTSYSCSCSKSFERWSSLLAHKKICKTVRLKCNICNKIFKQNISLQNHLNSHLSKGDFSCGYEGCTRSYSYKKNLIYHINKYHKKTSPRRIACTHQSCRQTFTKRQNLVHHMARYHSNDKIRSKKKPREPRKDKGILSHTSAAALLAGLALPAQKHRAIVKGESVKLPLVVEDATSNNPVGNLKENDEHVDNANENVTEAERAALKMLKVKLKNVLSKNVGASETSDTACNRKDNEDSRSYIKVSC